MTYGLTKRQLAQKVSVRCYRKTETMTRKEALDFYGTGAACCEGSEGERYTRIFWRLMEGYTSVSDEE